MKNKGDQVTEREVDKMIKDIRNFLVGREEFLTNQQYIGFEAIFQGYLLKDQFGYNFSLSKYNECNKIIARLSIKFYIKCQKHQNEVNNDSIK